MDPQQRASLWSRTHVQCSRASQAGFESRGLSGTRSEATVEEFEDSVGLPSLLLLISRSVESDEAKIAAGLDVL